MLGHSPRRNRTTELVHRQVPYAARHVRRGKEGEVRSL